MVTSEKNVGKSRSKVRIISECAKYLPFFIIFAGGRQGSLANSADWLRFLERGNNSRRNGCGFQKVETTCSRVVTISGKWKQLAAEWLQFMESGNNSQRSGCNFWKVETTRGGVVTVFRKKKQLAAEWLQFLESGNSSQWSGSDFWKAETTRRIRIIKYEKNEIYF